MCYDALDKNLLARPLTAERQTEIEQELTPLSSKGLDALTSDEVAQLKGLQNELGSATSGLGNSTNAKIIASGIIAALALMIVIMSFNPGWMAKLFDLILKLIVGMIVFCFVAVVYCLATTGSLDWNAILLGFIPNFGNWNNPAPEIQALLANLDGAQQSFWKNQIIAKQQESMIGVTATAVGLNMTFLLPYSMLARGWDKTFRGLATFDLITAMAIPYIVVTTCIVIASANAFHAKADPNFLSNDPALMQKSVLFNSTLGVLEKRYLAEGKDETEIAAKSGPQRRTY